MLQNERFVRFERFVLKSTFNQQANYLLGLLNTNYTNYTNKLLEDERFVRFERFVFKIQHSTLNIQHYRKWIYEVTPSRS